MDLPAAPPAVVDRDGRPRFGAYAGSIEAVDWRGLGLGRLYRLTHHKRWWYAAIATDEIFACFALTDLGYVASGYAYVVDLLNKKLLFDRSMIGAPLQVAVGPRPGAGAHGRFRGRGFELGVRRDHDARYQLRARVGARLQLEVGLESSATTALTLVCPVDGGGTANVTQKLVGLPATGTIVVDGKRFAVDGGLGGLDYTNGMLARQTTWRWGFGVGRDTTGAVVGWNLVEGFNRAAQSEDAIWVDGRPHPVRGVRFTFDEHAPLAPWQIDSDDGAVALRFTPIASHSEHHNLVIARSYFEQPAGHYTGTLRLGGRTLEIDGVAGVAEDQRITR